MFGTQPVPFQQSPSFGQAQYCISRMSPVSTQSHETSGPQVLRKSGIVSQHSRLITVPPASRHAAAAGFGVGNGVGSTRAAHVLPLQHIPSGHAQSATVWLAAGAQPQGPSAQVAEKSVLPAQQSPVVTLPPVSVQASASGFGVAVAVGAAVAVGVAAGAEPLSEPHAQSSKSPHGTNQISRRVSVIGPTG
jgi:hypothetical protein